MFSFREESVKLKKKNAVNGGHYILAAMLNPIGSGGGVDSTPFSEFAEFRLISLNKCVPRLSDF